MEPIPCYYSAPPGFIDPECWDGGYARYSWTYSKRWRIGLDISGTKAEFVSAFLPAGTELPDFFVCTKHCADWRQQAAEASWSEDYSIKSLVH